MYDFDGGLKQIHDACNKIGRDPASIDLGVFFAMAPTDDAIAQFADKGVKRVILPLPPSEADKVLPVLDTSSAIQSFIGRSEAACSRSQSWSKFAPWELITLSSFRIRSLHRMAQA
jgi:hypothetical protein